MPTPEDSYGISKFAVEQELKISHEFFGLNHVIFRPHNVYGEYQNIGDRYRNVVGIFMNQLMQGKSLSVFGDGSQTRSFCYVNDLVDGIYRLLLSDEHDPVNIGNPVETSILELAELINTLTGNPAASYGAQEAPSTGLSHGQGHLGTGCLICGFQR